ncbi:Disease resistance protein RUN1 [Linum perenne]
MASSSSSSSSAPQYTGNWKHDVFVCFRGDTRGLFTSHLAGYLHQRKIRVFTDDKLERTEDIDELLSILASSAMSVVIFSKKFAESRWCLNEVAIIAQSMEQFGHRVLPIFYLMNPEDVSEDSGSYSSMIDTIHKPCLEEKRRWMNALKVVANRAGRSSNVINDDYELCKTIVDDVLKILKDMSSRGEFNNLVGMDTRVSKVQQLLPMDTSNSSCIVGLLGMGGLGKTTLAKAWYQILTSPTNRIKHYFVSNVNRSCEALRGVEELVRELYASLLSEGKVCEQDLDVDYRRERLSRLKVVLVLDDVETTQQLEQLLLGEILDPTKLFGPGSIIIITSRNQQVLIQANAKIHTVEGLDSSESLHLFSLHAFKQCSPFDDLMDQSRRVVSYCKGNPLALKVLGGTLFGRNKEYWGSFISGLHNIDPEIHEVLSKSYYALKGEEQRLFMDVACFVRGTSKTKLIKYLATTYVSAPSILEDLIGKSLIFCVPSQDREMIEVHDLLKEMAWNIVNAEPNPSWLKKPSDIRKLFAVPEVSRSSPYWPNMMQIAFERRQAIESMILDLSKASKMCLGADAFDCMNSLRLLDVFFPFGAAKIQLPDDGLNMLPNELRWLEWIGFPSKCLPATFCPEKLVVLSLRHSKIESCWRGVQQPKLVHLIALNLSYCLNLTAVPDLSGCKKLELLRLKGCKSLVELPSHVQDLDTLIEVDLSECLNLMHLPAKLNSKCLKYVRLAKCPKVTICPEITNSGDLEVLDLDGTPVQELPSAIHKVKNGSLRLCGKYITSFPRISRSLKHFQLSHTTMRALDKQQDDSSSSELLPKFNQLELVGNSQLVIFPNNIWDMVRKELWVEGSPLIASLPDISSPGYDLTGVYLVNCGNLKSLPSGISNLKCLRVIHYGCVKIQSLPELPPNLEVFCVSGCKSLQALPSNTMKLNLPLLRFENCPQLDSKLPDQIVAGFPNCAVMSLRVKVNTKREVSFQNGASNSNSNVKYDMELPPPASGSNQLMFKGIAFGVVFSSDAVAVELNMKCKVGIGATIAATFSSHAIRICGGSGASSDYVFLWFDKKLSEEEIGMPWYVKYAGRTVSFQIFLHPKGAEDAQKVKNMELKRLGVSLLY